MCVYGIHLAYLRKGESNIHIICLVSTIISTENTKCLRPTFYLESNDYVEKERYIYLASYKEDRAYKTFFIGKILCCSLI